jgi:4-hydroxy 2-oxovalerate aldolase
MGIDLGIDIYKMMDLAEDIVKPLIPGSQEISKGSLVMGYAGVYSSFLLHAERASKRFNLDPRDILLELGKRKVVGGQEDMILDVAAEMANKKKVEVQS